MDRHKKLFLQTLSKNLLTIHNYKLIFLALADGETNKYILNGDQDMSPSKKSLEYGGIILDYSGSNAIIERINTSDTLTKDLIVKVIISLKLSGNTEHLVFVCIL
jgi:hypothetical protein